MFDGFPLNPAFPKQPLAVQVVQNAAGADPLRNMAEIELLLKGLPSCGLVALPEVFGLRGSDEELRRGAEPLAGGAAVRWAAGLARSRKSWVLAGSVLERSGNRVYNTSLLLDAGGRLRARYRKLHLFEARLETGQVVRERDVYRAGRDPVMAACMGWRCGLSICYDLRFPELYRRYSARGAHLLFAPSNFTQRTGRDHWEILVRCRAIENQCFVVAPNQCGTNGRTGVASHGNSMVVGPWGEILARAGAEPAVLTASLDPAELAASRRRVPALAHRRLWRVD